MVDEAAHRRRGAVGFGRPTQCRSRLAPLCGRAAAPRLLRGPLSIAEAAPGPRARSVGKSRRIYLAYRAAAGLLRALPEPVSTAIGAIGGYLASTLASERRALVAANLARVVGPRSAAEMDRLVRRAYIDYGHYWADAARLDPGAARTMARHWHIDGEEGLRKELANGRGAILALPHLGSWDVGGRWLASAGFDFTVVVEPLSPPELHEWFADQRRRLGMRVLALGPGTGAALVGELRAGRVIVLMADRDITGDGVEVRFFGETTRLPAGPAVLGLRTGAPIFPAAVYHERHSRHRAVIRPPIHPARTGRLRDDVVRVTAELASALEDLIRVAPEQWHVFQQLWPEAGAISPPQT